jgi:hypothetical protein
MTRKSKGTKSVGAASNWLGDVIWKGNGESNFSISATAEEEKREKKFYDDVLVVLRLSV